MLFGFLIACLFQTEAMRKFTILPVTIKNLNGILPV